MNERKRKKCIAWLLAFILLLTGCTGSKDEIPELIVPVVNNQSYRPVEYGRVGRLQIKIANVVPEEYCHFTKTPTQISEIKVDIGEHVEEGAVLAVVDIEEFQSEIDNKKAEITLKKNVKEYRDRICQEELEEQEFKKKACKEADDKKGEKECETQIHIIKENRRYNQLLFEHQVKMLNEEIEELNEYIEDGTIKARHSGYVSYIKDLSETSNIGSMENIVIVSDYDTLHIELEEDMSTPFYDTWMDTYDEVYTVIGGKEYAVEPYAYTNKELIAIQGAAAYPKIRFEMKGNTDKIHAGDKIPVYFASGAEKEVLKIGTDSLYHDGDQDFVYVKSGEDKERRDVKIGQMNMTDAEVISGLEEGEWVFYSSNAAIPEEYEEYTVKTEEYSPKKNDRELNYQYTYTKVYAYTQDVSALVESINLKSGAAVQKGDLVCVLDTGAGSAKIKEAENALGSLKMDYDKNQEEYKNQIKSLEKQIKQKEKQKNKKLKSKEADDEGKETLNKADAQESAVVGRAEITERGTQLPDEEVKTTGEQISEELPKTSQEPEAGEQEAGTGLEGETGTTENGVSQEGTTEKDTTQEKTEQPDSEEPYAYEAEQMECQKNILVYEKGILEAQYQYDRLLLQKEYEKVAEGNDGHGKINIYAKHSGVIGNMNIYEGKQIHPEEDSNLFQICDETSLKLIIDTGKDIIGVGNEVEFIYKSDDQKRYMGMVRGNSAMMEKFYLSEVGEKVYVTNSLSEEGRNKAYIVIDDQEFYDNQEGCNLSYTNARIQNAVVLPVDMVNSEIRKKDNNTEYYYVWKVVDGVLVKQYIKTDEALMTAANVCVLDGVKEGDVLAKQKVKEE
ncbi:MAG: hypothetical protein HFJ06_03530 [Lachnospiraceae bacterium]|nr:hypothetical protein [Lachnospiraceae bacterium]